GRGRNPRSAVARRPRRDDPRTAPGRLRRRISTQVAATHATRRPSSENLRKQLSTHNVECRDAVGQAQFIDVEPGAAVLPQQAITDIVSWLSQALDCPAVRTRV